MRNLRQDEHALQPRSINSPELGYRLYGTRPTSRLPVLYGEGPLTSPGEYRPSSTTRGSSTAKGSSASLMRIMAQIGGRVGDSLRINWGK